MQWIFPCFSWGCNCISDGGSSKSAAMYQGITLLLAGLPLLFCLSLFGLYYWLKRQEQSPALETL